MTTMTRDLILEIHSWWHAGTGRGEGPGASAVVQRTAAGLPVLPGRTVKGLIRETISLYASLGHPPQVSPEQLVLWFGTGLPRKGGERVKTLEGARYLTSDGQLRFTNATLGRTESDRLVWERWAAANRTKVEPLYSELACTRIDENGLAKDHTLRLVEVVVPLQLRARLSGPSDEPWPAVIEAALPLLRAVGSHRSRGLGRVTARIALEGR